MAFSSQAFTAPSLKARPKLGRTTVSSSIFRGASPLTGTTTTIKIPKGMQIGARASYVDPKYLKKESAPIEQTLVETNNILVEIQKQLSLDFAYRIAKEEAEVKKIRSATDKRKRGKAEEGVESVNKLGSTIGKTVDKIIAPTKNIFDRILQFFGALVGGFVINQGLKWLSQPGSIEKIQGFFDFLSKHANTILMVIGGVLVLRVVRKITRLYRLLRGIARFATGRGFGAGGAAEATKRGGLLKDATGRRRGVNVEMERITRAKPGSGGLIHEGVDVYKRTKSPVSRALQGVDVGFKKASSSAMKAIGMGPGAKGLGGLLRPIFKRIPLIGGLIDFAVSLALGEPLGRAAAKAVGATLGSMLGSFPPLIPFGGPIWGGLLGDILAGSIYDAVTSGQEQNQGDSGLEMNKGGTIPGPNVNKDIVPILGTPGEKVVPRDGSKRFGPFIDDIIYSGGELYQKMIDALKKQELNNEIFKAANEKFETVLKDYDDFVKKMKLKESDPALYEKIYGKGGGVSRRSLPPTPTSKMNVGNLMSSGIDRSPGAPMDFVGEINVNLRQPRMVTKDLAKPSNKSSVAVLPPINMGGASQSMAPSGTMTKAPAGGNSMPLVDAEDPSNFYVAYAMMELGIYGS